MDLRIGYSQNNTKQRIIDSKLKNKLYYLNQLNAPSLNSDIDHTLE